MDQHFFILCTRDDWGELKGPDAWRLAKGEIRRFGGGGGLPRHLGAEPPPPAARSSRRAYAYRNSARSAKAYSTHCEGAPVKKLMDHILPNVIATMDVLLQGVSSVAANTPR